jgi:hypothetical protein
MDGLIESVGRWFLHSGIQEENGGVARFYRSDTGRNARVSTEITGYAVSALLFLYRRTGLTEYLDSGVRGARFLTRVAWDARLGTFAFEHSANGEHSAQRAYFFDCGIIVRALLAAWRITGESEFLDIAAATGRAMLTDFRTLDTIHPILDLPDKRPLAYEPRWSATPGCYQLKAAMAWYDLFESTGEAGFLDAYESAVTKALSTQQDFLPGASNPDVVMDRLHAHAYFLEGVLPVVERPVCAEAFRAGVARIAGYLNEIAPRFVRSDVYAQLLRARLCGEKLGVVTLDQAAAAREAEQLAAFQLRSEDPRIDGGFAFGTKQGELLPFVNPVSAAFSLQSLAWWNDRTRDALEIDRPSLI